MEKIFPSCVHVRFERGRIQHSRVPFSSGVALRCHTFSTLDAETYTFAPVHIVVCCSGCASVNSLEAEA